MKTKLNAIAGTAFAVGLSFALTAKAAFTEPSATQIAAAAANPAAEMGALLSDAGTEQAANVVKAVIAKVLTLGLPSDVQSARIAAVITGSFAAIPAQTQLAFATALGAAVAGNPVIVTASGAVSQIQSAVAAVGGSQTGASLAQAFGSAYQAALSTTGDQGGKPQGEPPPVSTLYPGQAR